MNLSFWNILTYTLLVIIYNIWLQTVLLFKDLKCQKMFSLESRLIGYQTNVGVGLPPYPLHVDRISGLDWSRSYVIISGGTAKEFGVEMIAFDWFVMNRSNILKIKQFFC